MDEDGGGGVCGCASSAAVLVVVDARAGWRRPESGRGDKDLEERENGHPKYLAQSIDPVRNNQAHTLQSDVDLKQRWEVKGSGEVRWNETLI